MMRARITQVFWVQAADIPETRRATAIVDLAKGMLSDVRTVAELQALVEAQPTDLDARLCLAKKLFVSGDCQGGVNAAMDVLKRDKLWNDGAAKRTLMLFFAALASEDPISAKGRRRLSNFLFV